jgi:hypothetical protein
MLDLTADRIPGIDGYMKTYNTAMRIRILLQNPQPICLYKSPQLRSRILRCRLTYATLIKSLLNEYAFEMSYASGETERHAMHIRDAADSLFG